MPSAVRAASSPSAHGRAAAAHRGDGPREMGRSVPSGQRAVSSHRCLRAGGAAGGLEALYELEQRTNPRVRQEWGDISLVPPEERVTGPGASWVMSAFTHIGRPSRFSSGSFGVYYAARALQTSIAETVFHFGRFLAATREPLGRCSKCGRWFLQSSTIGFTISEVAIATCMTQTTTVPHKHSPGHSERRVRAVSCIDPSDTWEDSVLPFCVHERSPSHPKGPICATTSTDGESTGGFGSATTSGTQSFRMRWRPSGSVSSRVQPEGTSSKMYASQPPVSAMV